MKQNLYYRTVFRRSNVLNDWLLGLFFSISSVPRLLLEVFVRRNFGERYFSFSTAIITAFVLALFPFLAGIFAALFNRYGGGGDFEILSFLGRYLTWYLFLAGFVVKSIERYNEVKRLPSVFDFARFSLSAGTIHSAFYRLTVQGKKFDVREIETMIEPGFFFVIGLVLMILGQPVGLLIIVCSICYAMSYSATYHQGDNFIMDKIDEMILNEEYINSFVEGREPEDTRGVRYYGRTPADPEIRRQMVDSIIVDTDYVEAK